MSLRVLIVYTDRDGAITERIVNNAILKRGKVHGQCELRNQYRTFTLDRVTKAVDMETGEILRND